MDAVRDGALPQPAPARQRVQAVLIAAQRAAEDGSAGGAPTAFLFPDEHFSNVIQELGFNRNDGTLNLMPLVYFERGAERDRKVYYKTTTKRGKR